MPRKKRKKGRKNCNKSRAGEHIWHDGRRFNCPRPRRYLSVGYSAAYCGNPMMIPRQLAVHVGPGTFIEHRPGYRYNPSLVT